MPRPDWDEYLMSLALIAASRSVCQLHKVGAVFVDENHRVICTGYNGPLSGDPNCDEVGCLKIDGDPVTGRIKSCRGLHAEVNAINNYPGEKARFAGGTLYITEEPCLDCAKLLALNRIARVLFIRSYTRVAEGGVREFNQDAREFAQQHAISWIRYEGEFVNPANVLNTVWQLEQFPYQGKKREKDDASR